MKLLPIASALVLCLCLTNCSKDNSNPTTSIPRSGLELKADPAAQQYVVAVPTVGDTMVMQDKNGVLPVTTAVQMRRGSSWECGPQYSWTQTSSHPRMLALLFYRLDPYVAGSPTPVTCSLIADILAQDSIKVGDVSKYHYGAELFYNDGYHGTNDSYTLYALHTNYDLVKIIEKTPISSDANGCTTYRVRGTLHSAVASPTFTCGTYAVDMAFSMNAVQ